MRAQYLIALFTTVAAMAGCESWKDRVGSALKIDIQADQNRLASILNCWLPASWTGEYMIALSSVRVTDVRILGSEGKNARRYQADVELIVDRAGSSAAVRGLPEGTVRATFSGVTEHETKLRVMYAVPWIFSESSTHATLTARNGLPIQLENGAQLFAPPAATDPPSLAPGQSWRGSCAITMNMSDGQEASARVYDVVNVPVQARGEVRVEIVSQTPTALGFQLLPPDDAYPNVLAARVVPSNGTAQLRYVAPAAGNLRLMVWKMKLDPAGSYVVRSLGP